MRHDTDKEVTFVYVYGRWLKRLQVSVGRKEVVLKADTALFGQMLLLVAENRNLAIKIKAWTDSTRYYET